MFALEDSCDVRLDCVAEIAFFLGVDGDVAALANAVDCDISGGVGGEVFGVAFNDYFNIRPCATLLPQTTEFTACVLTPSLFARSPCVIPLSLNTRSMFSIRQ